MKKNYLLIIVLFCLNSINAQVVTTLAGSSTGDADGTGTAAQFNTPWAISSDANGNLYVADTENHKIKKITAAGVVTTLAGSTYGSTDGTGTAAKFSGPSGICTDVNGNIYVADTRNNRIRKITPTGIVSTIAGSTSGFVDGIGTVAKFNYPLGICIDATGNIYVGDHNNHKIRKITPLGEVTTLAGSTDGFLDDTGTGARFSNPGGVCLDANGNIYVADVGNHRIRKITPLGEVTTFAGSSINGYANGNGGAARFSYPFGISIDNSGNFYVADSNNSSIRKITPSGNVSAVAGLGSGYADGTGIGVKFHYPYGLCTDTNGNVYVADSENDRIRKITFNTLDINKNDKIANQLNIYPNPSSGNVNIILNENLILEKVNIYNTIGQLIKEEKNNIINVNSLPKGTYFFEIITDKGKTSKTILVN